MSESASSLLGPEWPAVQESTDAGAYYCAHILWQGTQLLAGADAMLIDRVGDPMIGFLHVPRDPWTLVGGGDDQAMRHAGVAALVAAALRGWVEQAQASTAERPLRVLLTGFGAFRDVTHNPTEAYVRDEGAVRATLTRAFPGESVSRVGDDAGADGLRVWRAGPIELAAVSLPVDDRCLAMTGVSSLRALCARTKARAWLGLGVGRSAHYRVEVRPTNAGLDETGAEPAHVDGRPESRALEENHSLTRAIVLGARVLEAQSRPVASA